MRGVAHCSVTVFVTDSGWASDVSQRVGSHVPYVYAHASLHFPISDMYRSLDSLTTRGLSQF